MTSLIVTGCTEAYRRAALELATSALAHGQEIAVIPYADTGRWLDSCRLNPVVLLRFLERLRSGAGRRPLLWVDADGPLCHPLPQDLFAGLAREADFTACPSRAGIGRRYCAGALWINATDAAHCILSLWAQRCEDAQGTDETHLHDIVETHGAGFRLGNLLHSLGWLPMDGPPRAETILQYRLSGRAHRAREARADHAARGRQG